jgi:cytochrome b involved in lipid metabolism
MPPFIDVVPFQPSSNQTFSSFHHLLIPFSTCPHSLPSAVCDLCDLQHPQEHRYLTLQTIAMSKTFTQSNVASHNKADSLWIVVDGDVYDLTKFQDDHPGM